MRKPFLLLAVLLTATVMNFHAATKVSINLINDDYKCSYKSSVSYDLDSII